jgi:uncharacterized protein (DUF4415 family)
MKLKVEKKKPKKLISVRLDPDLIDWLKKQSPNLSAAIESALKYVRSKD